MKRVFKFRELSYENDFERVGDAMVDANKKLLWGPNWVDGMWDCETQNMSESVEFTWVEGNFFD